MLTEKQLSTIGFELRKHREQLNQSIQDISRQMGVAPKCITAIETGDLGFFAGAKSEVSRLLKLYKRKLDLKADVLDLELAALHENNAKLYPAAAPPLFLLKTVSPVPRASRKLKMPVMAKQDTIARSNASSDAG